MKLGKSNLAKNKQAYLAMRIPLRAQLRCGFANLRSELRNYPNMHLASEGTELKYAIDCGGYLCLFTFGESHILEEIYTLGSPIYHLGDALLRMLSMIAYLGDSYEVKIESIFPYLIAALAGRRIDSISPKSKPKGGSDLILAKRITKLLGISEDLRRENESLRAKSSRLLFHLIVNDSPGTAFPLKSISDRYGVNEADVRIALRLAPNFSYRVIEHGQGRINVVKE